MTNHELIQWLLQNGGPSIRYRIAVELAKTQNELDIDTMRREMAKSPEVVFWLQNLKPVNQVNWWSLHGSSNNCFENAMNMLIQLGMHAGIPELDEAVEPFRTWLRENINTEEAWSTFSFSIAASFLLLAGYDDPAIFSFLDKRLETLYEFASKRDYNIYDSAEKYKGVPKNFRDRPVIKPELYKNGNYKFPLIYDIYGLSALIIRSDKVTITKVANIISYILTPDYHNIIVPGYGILASPDRKYHSMGWDARLPGYFETNTGIFKDGALLVQRLELMAHFPDIGQYSWFTSGIDHLETFRTKSGTYSFPAAYLGEKVGYWVNAAHMGLGENRKSRTFKEIESTFRMLKIKKLAKFA